MVVLLGYALVALLNGLFMWALGRMLCFVAGARPQEAPSHWSDWVFGYYKGVLFQRVGTYSAIIGVLLLGGALLAAAVAELARALS